MKHIFLLRLLQWTWGLPQNLLGGVLRVFLRLKRSLRKEPFRTASFGHMLVTGWRMRGSALSLGMFLFVPEKDPFVPEPVWVHESGHSVQSLLLGPLFLPAVGIPSLVWAQFFAPFRRKKNISYYSVYPEKWANRLGGRLTGQDPPAR